MKMNQEDYSVIKDAILSKEKEINKLNSNIKQAYKNEGLSPMRFRWDLLRATGLNIFGDGVGTFGDLNCYSYLDDTHIDTALRCITQTKKVWE